MDRSIFVVKHALITSNIEMHLLCLYAFGISSENCQQQLPQQVQPSFYEVLEVLSLIVFLWFLAKCTDKN